MPSLDENLAGDSPIRDRLPISASTRAEILIIGNEILSGKVVDEHAAFLCREFRALGVDVRRVVVLPDEVDSIADAVRAAWERADLIITTGGVGPTHDDVTVAGVAKGLKRPLIRHPELASLVREIYGVSNSPHIDRLADVPEGTMLLSGEGMRVPVLAVDKLYIFPGVPEIFRRKFNAVKARFRSQPFYLRTVYLRAGEESIAALLYDVAGRFPNLALGSYPVIDRSTYRTRLTLESKDAAYLNAAFEALMARLPAADVVSVDREPGP